MIYSYVICHRHFVNIRGKTKYSTHRANSSRRCPFSGSVMEGRKRIRVKKKSEMFSCGFSRTLLFFSLAAKIRRSFFCEIATVRRTTINIGEASVSLMVRLFYSFVLKTHAKKN